MAGSIDSRVAELVLALFESAEAEPAAPTRDGRATWVLTLHRRGNPRPIYTLATEEDLLLYASDPAGGSSVVAKFPWERAVDALRAYLHFREVAAGRYPKTGRGAQVTDRT